IQGTTRWIPDVTHRTDTPGDGAPILVVDDQPVNLDAIDAVLAQTGCRLVRASSADGALLALLEQDFAAIVLDIKMPGMNGLDRDTSRFFSSRRTCSTSGRCFGVTAPAPWTT